MKTLVIILIVSLGKNDAKKCFPVPKSSSIASTTSTTPAPSNPFWIALAGISPNRYGFLQYLQAQLSNENWPTHQDYIYSPDFMWNSGVTYVDGIEQTIPSACEGGPKGTLPKFDFIVVGSGPGGSVVASRVAKAFPTKTVLLIEAGAEPSINVVPPGFFPFDMKIEGTQAYHANPSPNYGNGFINGIKCDVGRALGGTTNVNAMAYVCGVDEDYNHWADVTGDSSWNYQNMLPHIRSIMNMHDANLTNNLECNGYYGTDGELDLGPFYSDEVPTINFLQQAAAYAGIPNREDFNCGKWTGFIRLRGSLFGGERQTASKAFLTPLKDHKNLMILRNAVVDKVILDESKRVKGLRVVTNNENCPSFEVRAKREVVLSAGAFNTPLILQRSGIGRFEDLNKFNIQQKLDLNVGYNYRDHIMSLHLVSIPGESLSAEYLQNEANRYLTARQGQFSYMTSSDLDAFLNVYDPSSNYPNIQWVFLTFPKQQSEFKHILEYTWELKPEYVDQIVALNNETAVVIFLNVLLKPKSSGFVGIRSTNPLDEPSIDSNFLSEESDVKLLIDGIREMHSFLSSPVMMLSGAKSVRVKVDECDTFEYETEEYWRCYIKYFTQTLWHPSGTAKMGKVSDSDAVVDNRLKVIGVRGRPNLRVSDASPIPDEMSGNLQCPVYSLAAKAAAMIIEDNQ